MHDTEVLKATIKAYYNAQLDLAAIECQIQQEIAKFYSSQFCETLERSKEDLEKLTTLAKTVEAAEAKYSMWETQQQYGRLLEDLEARTRHSIQRKLSDLTITTATKIKKLIPANLKLERERYTVAANAALLKLGLEFPDLNIPTVIKNRID